MSGAMDAATREATDKVIFRAAACKFAPDARRLIRANNAQRERGQSLPAQTWAAIAQPVRELLILATLEDFNGETRQSWEHFTDAQRAALAANARTFGSELRNAGCLW